MKDQIDAILQVGDLPYLKHYLTQSGFKNLKSPYAQKVMPNQRDSLLEMLCKKGHVDMLKFVKENNLTTNPGSYQNSSNQNCLHFAVMKNQPAMIKYLLTDYPQLAEKADAEKKETPLFYTLAKHKSTQTRASLSQLFLDHNAKATSTR